jgi:hypothetical protein
MDALPSKPSQRWAFQLGWREVNSIIEPYIEKIDPVAI